MEIKDINIGESYACRFKVSTFVDVDGNAIHETNLNIGEKHPGMPGIYEGIGIIEVRNIEQELVQLIDTRDGATFNVPWADCWDVDTVEWTDSETVA